MRRCMAEHPSAADPQHAACPALELVADVHQLSVQPRGGPPVEHLPHQVRQHPPRLVDQRVDAHLPPDPRELAEGGDVEGRGEPVGVGEQQVRGEHEVECAVAERQGGPGAAVLVTTGAASASPTNHRGDGAPTGQNSVQLFNYGTFISTGGTVTGGSPGGTKSLSDLGITVAPAANGTQCNTST